MASSNGCGPVGFDRKLARVTALAFSVSNDSRPAITAGQCRLRLSCSTSTRCVSSAYSMCLKCKPRHNVPSNSAVSNLPGSAASIRAIAQAVPDFVFKTKATMAVVRTHKINNSRVSLTIHLPASAITDPAPNQCGYENLRPGCPADAQYRFESDQPANTIANRAQYPCWFPGPFGRRHRQYR